MTIVQLYRWFKRLNLLQDRPKYWWPNAGSFEVVVGAILTQNTNWSNVEKSLKNLEGLLDLDSFLALSLEDLKARIRPSGFYNQKGERLYDLARAIKQEYGGFKHFVHATNRTWLLAQKGIGKESADAILCYACLRPTMVIDAYTKRVLASFGIECGGYDDCKSLIEKSLEASWEELGIECEDEKTLLYARFHGMFVEYAKRMKKGDAIAYLAL